MFKYDKITSIKFILIGAFKINSGLKIILHEVASKAVYHPPILKIDDYFDGGCTGSVYLMHIENGSNYYTERL